MLELIDICKVFDKNTVNEKVALDNVSLTLNNGDFVTMVGSNGAGKSTLLNAVAGMFPLDNGSIILNGNEITHLSEHQRAAMIGRVFQDPLTGTAAHMTVEENLVMAWKRGQRRRLRRAIRFQERAFFREQLAGLGLGLEDRLTTKVGLLSGGQRQALTLLMATMRRPQLLLLDEHIASLDPRTAEIVMDLTCRIVEEQQLTAIMVTHNLEQALSAGTRTVMMHEGRIVLDIQGLERRRMDVLDLMSLFEKNSGTKLSSDRVLLAAKA
ncbi:MAG: ABC transporter ATP-binding protein [Thermacetogeniaceae bacterium]|jgi:putative ABC transport system ATP-binding protein|nr:ATP-binding cassette domain-containing protein [Thermoanaerobacterales bacterium]NLN21483.1 ATP-binding cassette domain-containing protein [Syntrophomonadaceae bacterium]HAF16834.1 ABC transporter ATP-binding protein [Peptococcaceae bacterium]